MYRYWDSTQLRTRGVTNILPIKICASHQLCLTRNSLHACMYVCMYVCILCIDISISISYIHCTYMSSLSTPKSAGQERIKSISNQTTQILHFDSMQYQRFAWFIMLHVLPQGWFVVVICSHIICIFKAKNNILFVCPWPTYMYPQKLALPKIFYWCFFLKIIFIRNIELNAVLIYHM